VFPRCFTHHDWSRSYVLPDHVITTIPRTGSVDMLGAHNAARGLLVETCAYTGASPVALDYRETLLTRDGAHADILLEFTATARRPDGTTLSVSTATLVRRYPPDRVGDWTLTTDGVAQVEQDRVIPPSPPMQGYMAACLARRAPTPTERP